MHHYSECLPRLCFTEVMTNLVFSGPLHGKFASGCKEESVYLIYCDMQVVQTKPLSACSFLLEGKVTRLECGSYYLTTSLSPENVPAFIEAVKRREKTLSGFGHR